MKVLITTIRPASGGVPAMLRFVIDTLRAEGCELQLAYYQPYSVSPKLSVPIYRVFSRSPGVVPDRYHGVPCLGIGSWLPELEFTNNWGTKPWRKLIAEADMHLCVSGSSMPALPLLQSGLPFLAWVASDWRGDREHRVATFPWLRRMIDRMLVSPVTRYYEKRIIRSGNLIALSETSRAAMNLAVEGEPVRAVLSMPIDTDKFVPAKRRGARPTIGFAGRFEDPRKNLRLLFEVLAHCHADIADLRLVLVGDELSQNSKSWMHELAITESVEAIPYTDSERLPEVLQSMDLFVLPSHQEGLCIAALEAMSCGVPVVATRCGGPESYIVDGENGRLCDHNATSLSSAVLQLLADEGLREKYAERARETVLEDFAHSSQRRRLLELINAPFPALSTRLDDTTQAES